MEIRFMAAREELGKKGFLQNEIEGLHTEIVARPVKNEFFSNTGQVVLVVEGKAVVVALTDLESVVAAFKIQNS
jgi:hypothetical protein